MVTLTRLSRRSVWLAGFSQPFLYVIVQCGAPELSPLCSLARLDLEEIFGKDWPVVLPCPANPFAFLSLVCVTLLWNLPRKRKVQELYSLVGTVDAGSYIKLP